MDKISSFDLFLLKSRYLEWTDTGPCVEITNDYARFRIALEIRIVNTSYFSIYQMGTALILR